MHVNYQRLYTFTSEFHTSKLTAALVKIDQMCYDTLVCLHRQNNGSSSNDSKQTINVSMPAPRHPELTGVEASAQSRPGPMVLPQVPKVPVTLVLHQTQNLLTWNTEKTSSLLVHTYTSVVKYCVLKVLAYWLWIFFQGIPFPQWHSFHSPLLATLVKVLPLTFSTSCRWLTLAPCVHISGAAGAALGLCVCPHRSRTGTIVSCRPEPETSLYKHRKIINLSFEPLCTLCGRMVWSK